MNHVKKVVVIPYEEWKTNKKHVEEENVITLQTKKIPITQKNQRKCNSEEDKLEKEEGKKETENI